MSQTRLVPPHGLRVKTKMAAHCLKQFKFLLRYHIMVCLMCFLFYREYCVVELQVAGWLISYHSLYCISAADQCCCHQIQTLSISTTSWFNIGLLVHDSSTVQL